MDKKELLKNLTEITLENQRFAKELLSKSETELRECSSENSWSVLECIEHLNLYGNFYLPEIGNALQKAQKTENSIFKSGLLGSYFIGLIQPKTRLNKMKTASEMNPKGRYLTKKSLEVFITQQNQLLKFLQQAIEIDLIKTKTKISISKFIKLRLGDTLQFVVYHNQRHIAQIQKVIL